MHKIKKGIKKKIKGKKGKNTEIFTEEEYEQYKKQKEEESRVQQDHLQELPQPEDHHSHSDAEVDDPNHHQPQASSSEEAGVEATPNAEKEDWRNFLSSTDTVLKETSVNLEHIKESSYFQNKKRKENTPHREDPGASSNVPATGDPASASGGSPVPSSASAHIKSWVDLDKGGIDDALENNEEGGEDKEESRKEKEKAAEEEEKESLRNIVLKPIEDLPTVAAEDYADIFDTTYVDTVESGEIQLYQIPDSPTLEDLNEPDPFDTSNFEKVLNTEKEQPAQTTGAAVQHPKKKKKNLVNLGCAVDVLTGKGAEKTPNKSSDKEVNLLSEFEDKQEERGEEGRSKEVPEQKEGQEIVDEKSALDELLFGGEIGTDLPDLEFSSSIHPVVNDKEKDESVLEETEKENNYNSNQIELDEFLDPLASTEKTEATEKESHLQDLVAEFDVIDKAHPVSESLILESHAIDDNIKDEFDAEFAVLAAESLAKEKDKAIDEIGTINDDDPFDTSSVIKVLGESDTKESDIDFIEDYLQSTKPSRPQPPRPAPPKSNAATLLDEDPFDTSVADAVLPSDPFEAVETNLSLPETLQPQSGETNLEDSDSFDPFDTSVADTFGKTELKVLEGELLSDISEKKDIKKTFDSDFDFNPREEESASSIRLSPVCLLTSADENPEIPVLTPQAAKTEDAEDFDPFDTSIAEKVHIQSLETLLSDSPKETTTLTAGDKCPPPRPPGPTCLTSSLQNNSIAHIAKKSLAENFDPFDTSIAEITHTENSSTNKLKLDLKPPRPASPVCLLATTPLDENPTLQPVSGTVEPEEEFDPFDTSIANQFGKTELKVLETQLLTETINKVEVIHEFDPRKEETKPSEQTQIPHSASPACLLTSVTGDSEQQLPPLSPFTANKVPLGEEIDPFDTSIANQLGETEIKGLEGQLLTDTTQPKESSSFEFPENTSETLQLNAVPIPNCVFETTPTDNNPSLQPFCTEPDIKEGTTVEDIDPFDTSIADQFGKTELKALEESLLTQELASETKDTSDFSTNLNVETNDSLFDISPSAESIPVLQPLVESNTLTSDNIEIDPFDTSIAGNFGQVELKALESELLVDSGTKRNLSDDEDFDPRNDESKVSKRKTPSAGDPISILDLEENLPAQVLPVLQANTVLPSSPELDIDPFDTSIAENICPGQQELKLLDQELLGTK